MSKYLYLTDKCKKAWANYEVDKIICMLKECIDLVNAKGI